MRVEEFILTDNIELLVAKIQKLNKKALKLNCSPIVVTVTNETRIDEYDAGGKKYSYELTKIIIEGENPVLNGWSLVAVKHHDPNMGLMIDSVPEKEMPIEFRDTGNTCEHCKSNRIRNETFILEKSLKELTEDEMRFI